MMKKVLSAGSLAVLAVLAIPMAAAYTELDPANVVGNAGWNLPIFASEFGSIATLVALVIKPLINTIAILSLVIAGIVMTFAQTENQVSVARRTAISCVAAIMIVNGAAALRSAVIAPTGYGIVQEPGSAAVFLGIEVLGVIEWVQIPLATVAVLMIIISGIRAVVSWGSEEGVAQLRRTVISVVFGFTLIAVKFAFSESIVVTGRPDGLVGLIITIVNSLLLFLALIAVIVIIIAGIMMIVNIGNDDQYTKARNLIIRVAIGLLIVLASWAIVNVVFVGSTS